MKEIIYTAPGYGINGSVSRILPAYEEAARRGETEDELITKCIAENVPPGVSHQVIDAPAVPHDRYFRLAWQEGTGEIVVDMPKARVIHMDNIRGARNTELVNLDVPYMKALEAGDGAEQQRVANLKQTLRDIPQTFDLAKFRTSATLKAAWPSELPPIPALILSN